MNTTNKFSPEARAPCAWRKSTEASIRRCERRLKIGCERQTPLDWIKREEIDNGQRNGLTSSEGEVKELRRANDILKTASAFFA